MPVRASGRPTLLWRPKARISKRWLSCLRYRYCCARGRWVSQFDKYPDHQIWDRHLQGQLDAVCKALRCANSGVPDFNMARRAQELHVLKARLDKGCTRALGWWVGVGGVMLHSDRI